MNDKMINNQFPPSFLGAANTVIWVHSELGTLVVIVLVIVLALVLVLILVVRVLLLVLV